MGSRNRLTDPAALVGDTSTVINLKPLVARAKSCGRCRSAFSWLTSCRANLITDAAVDALMRHFERIGRWKGLSRS